jgi:hypothetical protein
MYLCRAGVSAIACLVLALAASVHARASGVLIIQFGPGAVSPPHGRTSAVIDSFSFNPPNLRDALATEGISHLSKLFPSFTPESRISTNLIGEEILLDDLSGFYLAEASYSLSSGADERLRTRRGIIYGWVLRYSKVLVGMPADQR